MPYYGREPLAYSILSTALSATIPYGPGSGNPNELPRWQGVGPTVTVSLGRSTSSAQLGTGSQEITIDVYMQNDISSQTDYATALQFRWDIITAVETLTTGWLGWFTANGYTPAVGDHDHLDNLFIDSIDGNDIQASMTSKNHIIFHGHYTWHNI